MTGRAVIRLADERDGAVLLAIYAPYIRNTATLPEAGKS
jgi:hypothetical protein